MTIIKRKTNDSTSIESRSPGPLANILTARLMNYN